MAVYFQFKSSTVRDSIPVEGHFISVGELKERIVELKHLIGRNGRKTSDIVISNYESKQDYLDDSALIPRHATVWARRVPTQASLPIIVTPPPVSAGVEKPEVVDVNPEDLEWDELLDVINGKSENVPAPRTEKTEEESRIKALVETPALGQGYGGGGWNAPPPGYICHRCKVAGHFIQHCPTNGDPAYDIKKFRPPPTAVLRPNEAAFDREMEGVSSSSCSAGQLPPELYCRLCKQVMKDAVLTSRCCFDSFCDRCIRGHIISKCSCVCGATNVLADHLIPNLTLRNTISRILESKSSSSNGEGGKQQVVDSKRESVSVKESAPAASRESGPLPDVVEVVQQKPVSSEAEKKKALADVVQVQQNPVSSETEKKKKALPVEPAAESYMMPMGHNPYWGGMQPGMNAFMPPYAGYGFGYGYGYGYGPMNMNMPFWGEQNMMSSGMGFNAAPPEVRKADGKRKRDVDNARDNREAPSSKKKLDHHRDHRDDHYHRDGDHSRRSSSHHHRSETTRTISTAERVQDGAYFPPEGAALKKQKLSSSSSNAHYEHKAASRKSATPAPLAYDEGSDDDDDRNFKRRSSWSKSSVGGRHY